MTRWLTPILLLWGIGWSAHAGVNHDSNLTWRTLESEHFLIHYHDEIAEAAQGFWPLAERVHAELSEYLDWQPQGKTEVVLTDEFDLSNGYARVFPRNTIVIILSAPDELNSLEDHNGWLELVFTHEYLHIVHLDMVRDLPDSFQAVFGRHPLLFPNAYQPRWLIEGIATYIETDPAQAIGRGQSSYYNMLMRSEAQEQLKPVRQVNQPIASWPGGHIPYLYGVHFFQFLRERYGEQSIQKLVEHYSHNLIPFQINSNSQDVLHKDIAGLWDDFAVYTREKFATEIARVEHAGVRAGEALTHDGYQAGSIAMHGEDIYIYKFNGRTHPAIWRIRDQGEPEKLLEVHHGARFTLHPELGLLISQPERCRNARLYYDLYRVDLDGRGYRRLTHCARYRHAVFSGDGRHIYAVHNEAGQNHLLRLDTDGQQPEILWSGKHGVQLGKLASSPEHDFLVVNVWQQDGGWDLQRFNLAMRTWEPLTRDTAIQMDPVFTQDGKAILYTADYDGIYNIYRYDLAAKQTTQLTNVISGAFQPAMHGTTLVYLGYSARGFDPYRMQINGDNLSVLPQPNIDMLQAEQAASVPQTESDKSMNNAETLPARDYSPWRSMAPNWWMPDLFIDDQRTVLGITTSATDALDRHRYSASIARDFENNVNEGSLDYFYDGLWPILRAGFFRDTELTVDTNSNPVRIRREDQWILETILPFLSQEQNIFLHIAAVREIESDVWTNGVAPLSDFRDDLAAIALRYNSTFRYPLSISRSEGRELRLIYEDTDVYGNSSRKGQVTVAEWREFIHLGREHVLALRLTEGRGRNNPARFQLGGIQDDDTLLSVIFNGERSAFINKREYSLRGYDEGNAQLFGRNLRLFSAEYRFPIARIERGWMAPPLGINQLHGTLFYDVGGVWETGSGPDEYYAGTGLEINADLDLFYNVRLNATLGFATGLDEVLGRDKVYFRIGSHF